MYRALANINSKSLPKCGIYMITNTTNGKCYIGSSLDIGKRLLQHRCALARGKHHNIHLQRAYKEYGEGSFVAEDLEICSPDERIEVENKWLENFAQGSYNIAVRADCPSQTHLSQETRQKISQSIKKNLDKAQRSEEMKSRWRTTEWRQRMKEIHCGRHYTPRPESVQKMRKTVLAQYQQGRVPWNKGKMTSEETRHRQSLARLGKAPANKGKTWDKERRCYA